MPPPEIPRERQSEDNRSVLDISRENNPQDDPEDNRSVLDISRENNPQDNDLKVSIQVNPPSPQLRGESRSNTTLGTRNTDTTFKPPRVQFGPRTRAMPKLSDVRAVPDPEIVPKRETKSTAFQDLLKVEEEPASTPSPTTPGTFGGDLSDNSGQDTPGGPPVVRERFTLINAIEKAEEAKREAAEELKEAREIFVRDLASFNKK